MKRRRRKPAWRLDKGAPAGWQRRLVVDLKDVYEVLVTGEVGSGKTDPGVMMPCLYEAYRRSAHFKGLVLRYNQKDLDKEIFQRINRAEMYPRYVGGTLNETSGIYRFRSGGRVICGHTKNLRSLQGGEYQYVWFDEATHWPDASDYLYVLTRLRSAASLPIRVRLGTNPGGPGHDWVKARWGPWLASNYLARAADGGDLFPGAASLRRLGYQHREGQPPLDSGVVLWYTLDEDGREEWVAPGTPHALSRSCLLTTTADNAALSAADPEYKYRVRAVGAELGQQLGKNNWDIKNPEGQYFKRAWFGDVLPEAPANLAGVIRRWDFAWTTRRNSDWSAGVKLGWTRDGHYYVMGIVRLQGKPDEVFATMRQTAQLDGLAVPVVIPADGTASPVVYGSVVRELAGFQIQQVKEVGKKELRIATLQPQAQAGKIHLVRGAWNNDFLDEVAAYAGDGTQHDDQLDARAGAFLYVVDHNRLPSLDERQRAVGKAAQLGQALDRRENSMGSMPSLGSWPSIG